MAPAVMVISAPGRSARPYSASILARHRLAQRRHAGHRRVLVQARAHRGVHRVEQRRVAVEVGEALAEVDRAVLGGQRRHHGEDGGADLRQAACDAGCGR